jgi:hypothetical protein
MKKALILICLLVGGLVTANGQVAGSTPTPEQATPKVISTSRDGGIFRPQRNSPSDRTSGGRIGSRTPAFRKPSKEYLRLVAPAAETSAKYADFLRQPKTGLVRLLSDRGCQEYSQVTNASEFCLKYKNLFGGAAYSFRTENYTLGRFADVVYRDGVLYTTGKMTLGFLVDLGKDVALDKVSAEAAGAKFVFDFQPPAELAEIETAVKKFLAGVEANNFKYQKFYRLEENHTYILRSVAYRKSERTEGSKAIYDDLSDDKRKDVIIAFQVVNLTDAETGGVTLLWKELQRRDTFKIAVGKD